MPLTYKINKNYNVVLVSGQGTVTEDEIYNQTMQQMGDPDYNPAMNTIYDFRSMTYQGGVTKLHELADFVSNPEIISIPSKTALVTEEDLGYGLSRMYSLLADASAVDYQVFRKMEDALEWLHLPEDILKTVNSDQ